MKRYFKFRKDFRCNWHGILGAFDTTWLEEQIVEYKYTDGSKHKWYNTSKLPLDNKHHYCDIFLFESEGETQEYADKLRETIPYVYFVKKEDEYDTIEELCDCYIIKDKDEKYPFIAKEVKSLDYANNKDRHNFEIFAAIWVKGKDDEPILIPVAKMNEKEELELL